jgi:hypothetical protein
MSASPSCRGLYTALCFLVLGNQRTASARAGDRRTEVLVRSCHSARQLPCERWDKSVRGPINKKSMRISAPFKGCGVIDVRPSI